VVPPPCAGCRWAATATRCVALALLLALPAWSSTPDAGVDAPIYVEVQPDGSRLVSPENWVKLGQKAADCEARKEPVAPVVLVVAAVVLLGLGAGAGLGVAAAAGRLK
jgi:hypothetical protein